MFIKIEDIGPRGLALSEPLPEETLREWLEGDSIHRPIGSGATRADVVRVGHNVLVRGAVSATLIAGCARCLKESSRWYDVPFTVLFSERVLHSAAGGTAGDGEEEEREGQDGEHQFFSGPIIELDEVLRDNLLLILPMAPLCAEDCGGLCPACGQDRNVGACGCAETNSPLAAALRIKVPEGTKTVSKGERSGPPEKKKEPRPPR